MASSVGSASGGTAGKAVSGIRCLRSGRSDPPLPCEGKAKTGRAQRWQSCHQLGAEEQGVGKVENGGGTAGGRNATELNRRELLRIGKATIGSATVSSGNVWNSYEKAVISDQRQRN